MSKLKLLASLVILSMMLGLLAACGDTPTATPVPTPTPLPPTATPAPPAPTNTTAAVTAPTAATGGQTPGATTGMEATASDIALINDALTGTQQLTSFHYVMDANGDVFTQAVHLEGDYVAPDKGHIIATMGGQQYEELLTGGKTYLMQNGKWVEQTMTDTTGTGGTGGAGGLGGAALGGFSPSNLTSNPNPFQDFGQFTQGASGYRDTQQNETINGVSTKHFTYDLDVSKMMGSADTSALPPGMANIGKLGGGDLWIDPNTKYLHRMGINLDFSKLMELLSQAFSALGGTPTPGGVEPTPMPALNINVLINLSKQNDPSISIPSP